MAKFIRIKNCRIKMNYSILVTNVSRGVSFAQRVVVPNSTGWSVGAMVLVNLPVPGRPTLLVIVGQGPSALVVGAGGGCLDIFTLVYLFSPLSPSLWETVRYRLKYCLKGPLNPKQPTNQSTGWYISNELLQPYRQE